MYLQSIFYLLLFHMWPLDGAIDSTVRRHHLPLTYVEVWVGVIIGLKCCHTLFIKRAESTSHMGLGIIEQLLKTSMT